MDYERERGTGDGGTAPCSDTAGILQLFLESTDRWYSRIEDLQEKYSARMEEKFCAISEALSRLQSKVELLEAQGEIMATDIEQLKRDQADLKTEISNAVRRVQEDVASQAAEIQALKDKLASGQLISNADLDALHQENVEQFNALKAIDPLPNNPGAPTPPAPPTP